MNDFRSLFHSTISCLASRFTSEYNSNLELFVQGVFLHKKSPPSGGLVNFVNELLNFSNTNTV